MKKQFSILITLFISFSSFIFAQSSQTDSILKNRLNTITTAVPFLMISPDSRGSAMGDAGVSSTPDVNSLHWNPAKYAFIKKDLGISISYSPWLKALVNDINLAYLSAYKKLDEDQAIAASLLYFSLGEINFTDYNGNEYYTAHPNELALDLAYSRKLSPDFSGGIALRFIRSNLTDGVSLQGSGTSTHPGYSIAADVSAYYHREIEMGTQKGIFALGLNISNIGAKISYTENLEKDFIPTNLRFGPSLTLDLDEYNSLSFMVDMNKLLVPTPPLYYSDSTVDGKPVINEGKDPNRSLVSGILGSFSDSPGGTTEEFHEINWSLGLEYWYDKQFAVRGGYFYEHKTKGNRKYFTIGLGLKYNVFGIDFAYLIPVEQRNPLENTLRFSLIFDFDAFASQNKEKAIN